MITPIVTLFQYLYFAEIVGFSLYLLALKKPDTSIYIWLASNAVGVAGSLYVVRAFVTGSDQLAATGAGLAIGAAALKATALAYPRPFNRTKLLPAILIIGSLGMAGCIMVFSELPYRLLFVAIGGALATTSSVLYLTTNRALLGARQFYFSFFVLLISIAFFLYLGFRAYPIGEVAKIIFNSRSNGFQFFILCIMTFFYHMAFIGLIMARQTREHGLQIKRTARIRSAMSVSRERESMSKALAEERYHLVKMLTHEVRQPLNTAQAALQLAVDQMKATKPSTTLTEQILEDAQKTLSSVVLSISNSILGSTLISGGRQAQLSSADLCAICELALLDLEPAQRCRIERKFAQSVIYAEVDPIILRLAIRNLLENAVKYSKKNTPIMFEVATDIARLALVIRVTNDLNDDHQLGDDIFGRYKRGSDSVYDGYGLGLFIATEVAKLHGGELIHRIVGKNRVKFEFRVRG